jgi:hypothetical protein
LVAGAADWKMIPFVPLSVKVAAVGVVPLGSSNEFAASNMGVPVGFSSHMRIQVFCEWASVTVMGVVAADADNMYAQGAELVPDHPWHPATGTNVPPLSTDTIRLSPLLNPIMKTKVFPAVTEEANVIAQVDAVPHVATTS